MKVIGLTGGTGSGKSIVSKELKARGAYSIDADEIAHDIIQKGKPAYDEIVSYFGEEILDETKTIMRKKLGTIVFSDKKKLNYLNQCTHKYINDEICRKIEIIQKGAEKYSCILLDAPLLIETDLISLCDKVWVVFATEQQRIKRIMERDSITYEQAENRIASQKKWDEYEKYAHCVIDNSKDLDFLKKQLDHLFYNFLNKGE